jgi:Domain of unknown function (DUF4034)
MIKLKLLALHIATLSVTCLLSAQVNAQQCAKVEAINYASHDKTVQNLRQIYQSSRFSQLDEILFCLIRSPERFQSGKSGASAVYWLFRREMPAPGLSPSALSHLLKWKKEKPQSAFVRFAELRLQYATAWNMRGSNVARDVPTEAWRMFNDALAKTEQAILTAPTELRDNPILHNLHLAVVQDMSESKMSPRAVFDEGVRRWPGYYDFYEVALTRLVPRWGGSWEDVDAFIIHWSKQLAAKEGDSMYARLYISVISAGAHPDETRISWPRMKSSLEELVGRYPDTTFKNIAASYACRYLDVTYLKVKLQQIGADQIEPSVWVRGTDPENCIRFAESARP